VNYFLFLLLWWCFHRMNLKFCFIFIKYNQTTTSTNTTNWNCSKKEVEFIQCQYIMSKFEEDTKHTDTHRHTQTHTQTHNFTISHITQSHILHLQRENTPSNVPKSKSTICTSTHKLIFISWSPLSNKNWISMTF
jgi:hypothetical protein